MRYTAFYYFAWRLAVEERKQRRELSGITQRVFLRRTEDPMDIYELEFKKRYLQRRYVLSQMSVTFVEIRLLAFPESVSHSWGNVQQSSRKYTRSLYYIFFRQ